MRSAAVEVATVEEMVEEVEATLVATLADTPVGIPVAIRTTETRLQEGTLKLLVPAIASAHLRARNLATTRLQVAPLTRTVRSFTLVRKLYAVFHVIACFTFLSQTVPALITAELELKVVSYQFSVVIIPFYRFIL